MPGSANTTLRPMPARVTVNTCSVCSWYASPARTYAATAGCPLAAARTMRQSVPRVAQTRAMNLP
jgi:hypothetical protein